MSLYFARKERWGIYSITKHRFQWVSFSAILPAMLVDGKAIAADIYKELKNEISHLEGVPHLTIFTCQPDFASRKYLGLKKQKAAAIGIEVTVAELPAVTTTEEMVAAVARAAMQTDGIVVQLPLPAHIDTDTVLAAIPKKLDVDVTHFDGTDVRVLPPVVGAIDEIARRHAVPLATSTIVIVGEGKLVGAPAALWAKHHGWQTAVVTEVTPHPEKIIGSANVLILGTGQARLVTPEMAQEGVVIFDAGTSEDGGALVGDAHPDCVNKAELLTPVPGGIGPITLAVLLRNLLMLYKGV